MDFTFAIKLPRSWLLEERCWCSIINHRGCGSCSFGGKVSGGLSSGGKGGGSGGKGCGGKSSGFLAFFVVDCLGKCSDDCVSFGWFPFFDSWYLLFVVFGLNN